MAHERDARWHTRRGKFCRRGDGNDDTRTGADITNSIAIYTGARADDTYGDAASANAIVHASTIVHVNNQHDIIGF